MTRNYSTFNGWNVGISRRSVLACALLSTVIWAQWTWAHSKLSPHWEDLTGPDFISAIHQSQGVCLLPFGIRPAANHEARETIQPSGQSLRSTLIDPARDRFWRAQ